MPAFTRRQLLAGGAALGATSLLGARARAAAPPKNLVVLLAFGGWDTMRVFDPKPGIEGVHQPTGHLAWHGALPIWVPYDAPAVNDFFFAHGDDVCVINGINARSIAHVDCLRRMLTGSTAKGAPDLGAIAAHALGQASPIPYLLLGERGLPGSLGHLAARVGLTGQIATLIDPASARVPLDRADRSHDDAVEAYLQRRALAAGPAALRDVRDPLDEYLQARTRAASMRGTALDWAALAHGTLATTLGGAADAIEAGFSRSVLVDSGIDWDTHVGDDSQNAFFVALFDELGRFLDRLRSTAGEADGATLLDETLVVVMSEMGRTPRYNGARGRDHWPYTSMMVMGGGVAGGRVLGGTDERLIGVPVDLDSGAPDPGGESLAAASVVAGLLGTLGIDSDAWLPGVPPLRLPTRDDAGDPHVPGPFADTAALDTYVPCRDRSSDSGDSGGGTVPRDDSGFDDDSGGSSGDPCGDSGIFDRFRKRRTWVPRSLRGPNGSLRPGAGTALHSTVERPALRVPDEGSTLRGEPLPSLLERLNDER